MRPTQTQRSPEGQKAVALLATLGLLATLAATLAWIDGAPPPGDAPSAPATRSQASAQRAERARDLVSEVGHGRRTLPVAEPTVAQPGRGRVLDLHGGAVARVRIGHRGDAGESGIATSDADGGFPLPEGAAAQQLVVLDPRWTTVQPGRLRAGTACTIVVAPRIAVAGVVVDPIGQPITGALLAITLPGDTAVRTWLTLSGDDGRFGFDDAPAVPGARLQTQQRGRPGDDRLLPATSSHDLVVRLLDQPRQEPVHGTVFGPDGSPVAAASVRVGAAATVTSADGTFSLAVPPGASSDVPLLVYAAGLQPSRVDGWCAQDGRSAGELIVLLRAAQQLRGRVVDANGLACADWFVTLADPTPLDANRPGDAFVENSSGGTRVLTDAVGAFCFEGVFARPYTLEAWSADGRAAVRSGAVSPGGGDLVLTVRPHEPAVLHGRVVLSDGRPVLGATVGEQRLGCATPPGASAMRFDTRAITDADGRFELPLQGALHLIVDGTDILPVRVALETPPAARPMLVHVARRVAVSLDCGVQSVEGLALIATAADGRPRWSCDRYGSCAELVLAPDCTDPRSLPGDARAVILEHRGVELGQLPLPAAGVAMELCISSAWPAYAPSARRSQVLANSQSRSTVRLVTPITPATWSFVSPAK